MRGNLPLRCLYCCLTLSNPPPERIFQNAITTKLLGGQGSLQDDLKKAYRNPSP